MKSGIAVLFAIGALVIHSCNAQAPSCIGLHNGFTINNPTNDNDYFICLHNVPIPMVCPTDFVFCAGARRCTRACADIPTPETPTTIPDTITPTPPTPPTRPPPHTPATPPTRAPATTVTTITPATPTPAPAVNVCEGKSHATIYADPENCAGYFICANGVPKAGKCLRNHAFDATIGACSNAFC